MTQFNPADHTITMERRSKQKDGTWLSTKVEYLPVQYRLLWFRLEHPKGKIESLPLTIDLDRGAAIFETYVEREDGGSARIHGSETLADWKDFIEKAETKSLDVQPANGSDFKLAELQSIVSGHIEIISCKDGRIIVANEESKLLDMPRNEQATALVDFPSPEELRARISELEAQGVAVITGGDLDEPDYIAGVVLVCESHEVK